MWSIVIILLFAIVIAKHLVNGSSPSRFSTVLRLSEIRPVYHAQSYDKESEDRAENSVDRLLDYIPLDVGYAIATQACAPDRSRKLGCRIEYDHSATHCVDEKG